MLIRLISLVILFNLLYSGNSFSVDKKAFLYPKDKPSIFKNSILKKKPSIKTTEKNFTYPKNKPSNEQKTVEKIIKEKTIIKKDEKIKQIVKKHNITNVNSFLYPKKKQQ